MSKNYKVAIAGCGGVAHVHAIAIGYMDNITLIACCDEKESVNREFGEKYGCKSYRSMKELLDVEKPDAIHICTPHYTHVPLSVYALSRGINVFLEKPVATTITDMLTLQDFAKKSSAQLGVCFQNRYNPSTVYAKELIDSGKSGKILGGRAIVTWSREDSYYLKSDWRGSMNTEGAGVLINQSIHTIDLMHYLTGKHLGKPQITGTASTRIFEGKINVEDTAEATFKFNNGVRILFYATVGYSKDAGIMAEIHCENMTICIEGDNLRIIYPNGSVEYPTLPEQRFKGQPGKDYWGVSHGLIIEDFYRHLENGDKFHIDAVEGGIALYAVFQIRR